MDFVTKNNVKIFLKKNGMRVATLSYGKLGDKIEALLKEACGRAKENGRSTVMPQDL